MALSDDWRLQKSSVPAMELAYALRALKKVIGGISPSAEAVLFGGMSMNAENAVNNGGTGKRTISIDRAFALKSGQYPIPSEDFDVLVGLASHEAGHTVTRGVTLYDIPTNINRGSGQFPLESFVGVAEEIYNDGWMARHHPVQHQYIKRARIAYDVNDEKVDWSSIPAVWVHTAVYGHDSVDISARVPKGHQPIYTILKTVENAVSSQDMPKRTRIDLYGDVYNAIAQLLATEDLKRCLAGDSYAQEHGEFPEELRKGYSPNAGHIVNEDGTAEPLGKPKENIQADPSDEDSLGGFHNERAGEVFTSQTPVATDSTRTTRRAGTDQVPDDVQKVFDEAIKAIETDSEDLTEEIRDMLDARGTMTGEYQIPYSPYDDWQTGDSPIIYSKAITDIAEEDYDPRLLHDLDWIKRIKNAISRQVSRSQPEGILDRRRLHRYGVDGKVYKVSRTQQKQRLDLVLLLDASSSMAGRRSVYRAAQALHKIIPEATVLSYCQEGKVIRIVRQTEGKAFRRVIVSGGTPSGKALIVAALQFPRSLIVHFTDGESNTAVRPGEAFDLIKDKYPNVQVANIVFGGREAQYPNTESVATRSIGDINEFPEALKDAIKPWYQTR